MKSTTSYCLTGTAAKLFLLSSEWCIFLDPWNWKLSSLKQKCIDFNFWLFSWTHFRRVHRFQLFICVRCFVQPEMPRLEKMLQNDYKKLDVEAGECFWKDTTFEILELLLRRYHKWDPWSILPSQGSQQKCSIDYSGNSHHRCSCYLLR